MAGQSVVPLFGMIHALQMWLKMPVKIVPSRKRQLNRQTCPSSFVSLRFDAAFGALPAALFPSLLWKPVWLSMLEVKSFNSFNGRPISCTSFWHDTCLADVVDDACEDSSQQEKTAESPNLYIYIHIHIGYIYCE